MTLRIAGWPVVSASILFLGLLSPACSKDAPVRKREMPPVIGRWDITAHGPKGSFPSWLEVRRSGTNTLVGSYVGQFGSARPISKVIFEKDQIQFALPPQWERRTDDQVFKGTFENDVIRGETTDEKGQKVTWEAHRAPSLIRTESVQWGEPVELFNGRDLTGWRTRWSEGKNGWVVQGDVLVNATPGNDLLTTQTFNDFQLVAEFRYPQGSNSGIHLRGRYEVQIEDSEGDEPDSHKIGGVYGFLTPCLNAARKAGEWQTIEITLIGRTVTVVLNGERIIDRQSIPGITGGALDSDEAKPGPLMLQGDHGPVEFRKVTLTPGK